MKINNIRFENFKCFKKLDLELGRVTLLTGANSSGKSSVIYGILGALQSGEFPLQFSPNGKYVEMGDFQELSNNHDKSNIIKIGFDIGGNDKVEVNTFWEIDKIRKLPKLNSFTAKTDFYTLVLKKEKKYKLKFEYFSEKDPMKKIRTSEFTSKLMEFISEMMKENGVDSKVLGKDIKKEMKPYVELEFKDFSEMRKHIFEKGGVALGQIFQEIMKNFKNIDKEINYISSFRLHPDRTYYEQSKTNFKIGKFGERYTDQLIQWQTKKSKKYKELISHLNKLELVNEIKAKRLEGGRYELLVKPKNEGVLSSLADVGFGISQFLPILIADLQLSDSSTLFVSQPEIHLHPSIQANFADYLINQIKKTNKSYIIETHSEYLINRLRLAIVKKESEKKDIKSYFFLNNGIDVTSYELDFTETGQIKNAPEDFFKTYMMDVMEIALNSFE